LIIEITQGTSDKPLLKLAIPIFLAKIGSKFIPKDAQFVVNSGSKVDLSSIDWEEIFNLASSGEVGDILNLEINDNENVIHIRIYVN